MEPEYRIGKGSGLLMTYTAMFYDGVQAILTLLVVGAVLNYVITGLAILTFFFWFKMKSIALLNQKTIKIILKGGAVEMIPVVNAWPSTTRAVRAIIKLSREEDLADARETNNVIEMGEEVNEPELLAA